MRVLPALESSDGPRRHRDNEIDIEQDPSAADFVMGVNGGNAVVPTLVFPDGSTRTNPSIGEVKTLLGL